MNILDLIILIFLLLGVWHGFRRGFIMMTGGLLGFLGGIWLAGRYYITVAQFAGVHLGLNALFTRILIPFTAGIPTALPVINAHGQGAPLGWPPSLWVPVSNAQAGIHGAGLAIPLTETIVKVIAFFLILALVSCLAMMLASLLSKVARMLLLGGLDRLGGVGLGLVTRTLELVVVIGLLTPVVLGMSMGLPGQGGLLQGFFQAWHQSTLIPLFNGTWNQVAPALKGLF